MTEEKFMMEMICPECDYHFEASETPEECANCGVKLREIAEEYYEEAERNSDESAENTSEKVLKLYEKSALLGNIKAEYLLGNYYQYGNRITLDNEKARKMYELAARQGDAQSQVTLGNMYQNGDLGYDAKKAFYWYDQAALSGNLLGLLEQGKAYERGIGTIRDLNLAIKTLRKASNLGNILSKKELGRILVNSRDNKDVEEAINLLIEVADSGDGESQFEVGRLLYLSGKYGDEEKSIFYYKKSVASGFFMAAYHLGRIYYEGRKIKQNYSTAVYWFKLAANNGISDAIAMLGNIYASGKGVEKNYSEAIYWFNKGAKINNPISLTNLAALTFQGLGVDKDLGEATKLFEMSAKLGETTAMTNLSTCYAGGYGVPQDQSLADYWAARAQGAPKDPDIEKDEVVEVDAEHHSLSELTAEAKYLSGMNYYQAGRYEKAFEHFQAAADEHHTAAIRQLGMMYEYGQYVLQNDLQAFSHYLQAANDGDSEAQYQLASLYEYVLEDSENALYWYDVAADQQNNKAMKRLEENKNK